MDVAQTRSMFVVALVALVISAWTGVLLRFGFVTGMPEWAQNFAAVRHAHSHLMYFGWVTLSLMALIWADLPRHTGRQLPAGVRWQMWLTAAMALLSFPAFWANGYGLTQIGPVRLPLGSIVSTLNGLTWFYFIGLYVRATWGLRTRPLPVRLWDWALVLLLVASGGAAGLVGVVLLGLEHPFLRQLFLHQFLDLFAVGWLNLAIVGVLWSRLGRDGLPHERVPVASMAVLLLPTFVLGVTPSLVPEWLFWLAAFANAGAAGLLSVHLRSLWQRRRHLLWPAHFGLAALAVIVLSAYILLIPGFWSWSGGGQLRIFYLHTLLLAWISTQLITLIKQASTVAHKLRSQTIETLWVGGTLIMLVALLGIGFSMVLPIAQTVWLAIAAWAGVAVALASLLLLIEVVTVRRPTRLQDPWSERVAAGRLPE